MTRDPQISNRRLLRIFMVALIGVAIFMVWKSVHKFPGGLYAVAGQLSLSGQKLQNEAVPLDGEWKFAWNALHSPESFPTGQAEVMTLPRIWNGFTYGDDELPAHGYGTYQLEVAMQPGGKDGSMALYIPFIHSSYALYLQDQLVASDGTVGRSPGEYTPSARTQIIPFTPQGDTLKVTLQVANFAYSMGGVWQSLRMGTREMVQKHYDRQLAFDLFTIGGLFLMSIYHIALFFMRPGIRSNLYFGLLCFFLSVKNLFTGVVFFYTLWPGASYEIGLKLIHISIFASVALLWLFLRELFENDFPRVVSKSLLVLCGLGIAVTLVFPSPVYSALMFGFWIVSGVVILLILRGIYRAVIRKKEGAQLILAGIVCFMLTVGHDLAIDARLIQSVYLAGAGFFLFIFSQSLLLAVKFTNSFQNVENLTEDLINTNTSFSRFVPDEYLSYLNKKSILDVELGDSVQREMTVFFSDIRSFTSLSESMSPKTNFAFINDYLGHVVDFIHSKGGLVNQYLGDGVLALFTKNPVNAVQAAVQIQVGMSEVRTLGGFELKAPIQTGIGIHTGPLILGMMGTDRRLTPSVISDTVNTASRLEGLTKFFGAQIIVSEPALMQITDLSQFEYRFLGKVTVKGKQDALKIYEIMDGLPEAVRELKTFTKRGFEAGLELYFKKDFSEAMARFNEVLSVNPDDLASRIYFQNSQQYMNDGVYESWEGALKMELK
ncbi:adenylate/guanylate cyclase domain-containing protein [Robiginitalea marina]|uniref:Adenylate/guanylate cyclase domain-containing protein n=1 Tax=Robiginitalea marina TaxID=2954105 RepID=A0ABT1AUP6_9FLAO|nr:adenylate/guanylate cyclase domain-containing protein [Robiginitalea marina]MCO5723275.1 adenylate/guanylate cyclase domain-containing protein [Robiginitalea marina]